MSASQSNNFIRRAPQLYIVGFLTLHGLIFLGVGYLVSYSDPGFSLMHSGIGVLVYSIFLAVLFTRQFIHALVFALITVIVGMWWGDFLVDIFYPASLERTSLHQAYAMMLSVYLYTYLDVVWFVLTNKKTSSRWFR